MKAPGIFIMGVVLANCWCGQPLQADVTPGNNPYTPIIARNIFGLLSIPTNPPVDTGSAVALARITPNGIMTLFGNAQVLFKVLPAPVPGQLPAREQSFILGEGESEDGIEVEKIDEKSAIVTFDNHGTIQELSLNASTAAGDGRTSNAGLASSAKPGTSDTMSSATASDGRPTDDGTAASTALGAVGARPGTAVSDGQIVDDGTATSTTPGTSGAPVRARLVRELNLPTEYPPIGSPDAPAPDIYL